MNLYATLTAVKNQLRISAATTTHDAVLMTLLESASREVDGACSRHFFVETATRYFDTNRWCDKLFIDDLLTLTSLAMDSDDDQTYDGETWVSGTDFTLWPDNYWPKLQVRTTPQGDYSFASNQLRYVKAVGRWGYGDGTRQDPVDALTITGTVATTNGTTLTVSASTGLEVGHTIRIESEDMFVSAISETSVTVTRAVNGTTASTHSAAAVYVYTYPTPVSQYVIYVAAEMFNVVRRAGIANEMIGQYQYTLASATTSITSMLGERLLSQFKRLP